MTDYKYLVKYDSYHNRIAFPPRIASGLLPEFAAAVQIWQTRRRENTLTFDFYLVQKAYANGMLGIIAIANELRRQGTIVNIRLPQMVEARGFFSATSWTHLLDPSLKDGYKRNNGQTGLPPLCRLAGDSYYRQ